MKKFKNNFGVKGSLPLLMALKEEVEKLGWKYDSNFSSGYSENSPDLYFKADRPKDDLKVNHFSFSNVYNGIIYNLPQQWYECLKAASELEEDIPEYVKAIDTSISSFGGIPIGLEKGKIYKVLGTNKCPSCGESLYKINLDSGRPKYCSVCDTGGLPSDVYHTFRFRSSTKEAYEKQQEKVKIQKLLKKVEPWAIGTYVVFLKEYGGNPKGTISSVVRTRERTIETEANMFQTDETCCLFKDKECKWFPTLQEAEAFSKELLEEEFVLPKKWGIRQNAGEEVCTWFNKKYGIHAHVKGAYKFLLAPKSTKHSSYSDTLKGHTEITKEQFNKYVLNAPEIKEEAIKIAGYNVGFQDDNKVSIGCYTDISLKDLKAFRKVVKIANKFSKELTINLNCIMDEDENMVTLEEIEELIERLNG